MKNRYLFVFRLAFAFCLTIALQQFASAQTSRKEVAETVSTQSFRYDPGGVIQLKDSFGEVYVEGWDQPSVEITVIKGSRKKYSPQDQARALEKLDRIKVTVMKESDNRLVVSTKFPSRSLFARPFRGKTNLKLLYKIKAPRRSVLDIDHSMGVVSVTGIAGDARITNSIGEISLSLPPDEYDIDAKSKLGGVTSQFDAKSGRPYLLGATALRNAKGNAYRLYLRVGIGEIEIKKSAP